MNYHLEHHLYPAVPYYHLPRLYKELAPQCPPAYQGFLSVFIEMIPVLLKQRYQPDYHIVRPLPEKA
jgi:fatty acid desaturase